MINKLLKSKGVLYYIQKKIDGYVYCLKKKKELNIIRDIVLGTMRATLSNNYSSNNINKFCTANINNLITALTYLKAWHKEVFTQDVQWENVDILYKCIKEYGTCIVATIHYGNHYLLGLELAKRGLPITAVVGNQGLQAQLLIELTHVHNVDLKIIMASQTTLLYLLKELHKKRIVFVVVDELNVRKSRHTYNINFLKCLITIQQGIFWLQRKTHLPIVPAVAIKINEKSYKIVVYQPLKYSEFDDARGVSQIEAVEKLFKLFESIILNDPAQWLNWIHLERLRTKQHRVKNESNCLFYPGLKYKIQSDYKKHIIKENIYLVNVRNGNRYIVTKAGSDFVDHLADGVIYDQLLRIMKNKHQLSETQTLKAFYDLNKMGIYENG